MTPLRIEVERRGATTVVRAAGEIDIASAPALRQQLAALDGDVVVDLSAVTFMDSSGINALVATKNQLDANGGTLTLEGPQHAVHTVLRATGLGHWFDVE